MSRTAGWLFACAAALALAPSHASRDRDRATPPRAAFDVTEKSIAELQRAQERGAVTSRDLVDAYLARIAAYDQIGPALNAFITINGRAREAAEALDRERRERGPRGPLHGIPVVVKDNFDTVDMPTTGGSIALATNRPEHDAFQVEWLRAAGAVILGKTNLHELASGIVTVSSLGGQTRNPYDPRRNPGGSSGGTGAAVAASLAAAGLGTDTCGSIRIPASFNNLVGLRPTLGLSSRAGVIPLSHTQDVAGPLGRTIEDVAVMLDATAGYDPRDSVTEQSRGRLPASYLDGLAGATLRGARIGVLASLFGEGDADAEVGDLVRGALDRMRSGGAVVVDVAITDLAGLQRGSSVIDYEFKSDLAAYLASTPRPLVASLGEILDRGLHHEAVTGSFRRRNAAESTQSDAYQDVLVRRERLRRAVLDAMTAYGLDALAYPTVRRKPVLIGQSQGGSTCQLSASTGLPALSLPAAFTADGLPVGMELLGRPFGELGLLRVGRGFEQVVRVRQTPPLTPPLDPDADARQVVLEAITGNASKPVSGRMGLRVTFTWDPTRHVLAYHAEADGLDAADLLLAVVRQGTDGPIVGRLLRTGETVGVGELRLQEADRQRLLAGELVAQLFTRTEPLGGLLAPIHVR